MSGQRSRAWQGGGGRRWMRIREQVLQRHGATCWLCREAIDLTLPSNDPGALNIDHIYGRAATGDDPAYLAPSHRACNQARNRQGGYVPPGDPPAKGSTRW